MPLISLDNACLIVAVQVLLGDAAATWTPPMSLARIIQTHGGYPIELNSELATHTRLPLRALGPAWRLFLSGDGFVAESSDGEQFAVDLFERVIISYLTGEGRGHLACLRVMDVLYCPPSDEIVDLIILLKQSEAIAKTEEIQGGYNNGH